MADLNVQPKKTSILPWILLGIGLIALLYFLTRGCNDDDIDKNNRMGADTVTTTGDAINTDDAANTVAATSGWEGINYDAPAASYEEITNRDIEVRSDDRYAIYSLGENILFDVDKSTIRAGATENLKQIAESIRKRYGNDNNNIRIYGFTSAPGSANYNKQLAEERAAAVQTWLVQNGNINNNRISLHPVGEARPAEANTSAEGRQENRRVEIVVKRT